ncbi:MAG: histidine phosphatase family protein [Aestuariivirga sp.]
MNRRLPPIIFVRHGETDWNAQGFLQGSIDTELNAKGRTQVQAVALGLLNIRDELAGYDFIVSPQVRAQETMAAIIAWQERPAELIRTEPLVRELGFGIWEGKPFWELKASPIYPADPEDRFYWRPEGGESYQDGVARVDLLLAKLERPTLIVAHGAIGRCLMGVIGDKSPGEIVNMQTPQGCYCRLENGTIAWFDANKLSA